MASDELDVMRHEAQAIREFAELQLDPLFAGIGVPHGDGRLVLVVPGLFGNDVYLQPMRDWLRRIGYTPAWSGLWPNAGCPERLSGQLERALERQRAGRSGPIAIVGHSRGGMLAWVLAARLQEQISHLVLLGSPAGAVVRMVQSGVPLSSVSAPPAGAPSVARTSVMDAGRRALRLLDPDCDVPACGCAYTTDLGRHLHERTRVLTIGSRDDRIVPASSTQAPGGEHVEVGGTHGGLVVNRDALRHVARFLAS